MIAFFDMIDGAENKSKFNQIYETYKVTIYAVAYDILKNVHDSEDAAEESLIKIIGILDRIEMDAIGTAKCKNLMITIAKNTAIDYWRKQKHLPDPIAYWEEKETVKSTEELYIDMENYQDLLQCITELDDRYRDVLNLRILHHLSSRQAGNLLGISEDNVNMRFMRARRLLAKKLKERSQNE